METFRIGGRWGKVIIVDDPYREMGPEAHAKVYGWYTELQDRKREQRARREGR